MTRGAAYISSLRRNRKTLNSDELSLCQPYILKQGPHSPPDLMWPFFRSAMFLLLSKVILRITMSFQKVPKIWRRQPATAVVLGMSPARAQQGAQGWSTGLQKEPGPWPGPTTTAAIVPRWLPSVTWGKSWLLRCGRAAAEIQAACREEGCLGKMALEQRRKRPEVWVRGTR